MFHVTPRHARAVQSGNSDEVRRIVMTSLRRCGVAANSMRLLLLAHQRDLLFVVWRRALHRGTRSGPGSPQASSERGIHQGAVSQNQGMGDVVVGQPAASGRCY